MTQNRLEPANSLIAVLNELDESAELVLVIPSKKQTCLVELICDSFHRLWYKFWERTLKSTGRRKGSAMNLHQPGDFLLSSNAGTELWNALTSNGSVSVP